MAISMRPKRFRVLRYLLRILATFAVAFTLFHLTWAPLYRFPDPKPFAGDSWYNPYEDHARYSGRALKANLHNHSYAWWGLTSGTFAIDRLEELYEELGYDVAPITNYQEMGSPGARSMVPLRAYEHALSLGQQHQTVLGADSVCWFDYAFYQLRHQKQHVLDVLGARSEALILNHPSKGQGYSLEDMQRLTGYHAIEIFTKYTRRSMPYWDAALSAGRPVFGVCSDDGHKHHKDSHYGRGWTMIHSDRSEQDVLRAIRAGRFHSIWDEEKVGANELQEVELEQGVLRVRLARPADAIQFIGQGGALRQATKDTQEARYTLRPDDTYVRVECHTNGTYLFLNPVFRHAGAPFEYPRAEALMLPTWFIRVAGLVLFGWLGRRLLLPRRASTSPA